MLLPDGCNSMLMIDPGSRSTSSITTPCFPHGRVELAYSRCGRLAKVSSFVGSLMTYSVQGLATKE
ncbi:hypothetical protein PILCRDRAFT_822819 [Piloderma croceum F 1598]|uniref:Uncharacterized protein n=1 Tax=Piloderma croceum (strain F 1598) TaxID=765440 RepID=A0A0C3FKA7_PILCF|nr:hypothetical protein PILCRDRAFT_822819 [Piloderma croceum F 1598]